MLNVFQSNLVFFYSPKQVAAPEAPAGRTSRLGGLVVPIMIFNGRRPNETQA